jgi:putative transposase
MVGWETESERRVGENEPGQARTDLEAVLIPVRPPLPNAQISSILSEAQAVRERWRQEYNTFRPHSSVEYRPPA